MRPPSVAPPIVLRGLQLIRLSDAGTVCAVQDAGEGGRRCFSPSTSVASVSSYDGTGLQLQHPGTPPRASSVPLNTTTYVTVSPRPRSVGPQIIQTSDVILTQNILSSTSPNQTTLVQILSPIPSPHSSPCPVKQVIASDMLSPTLNSYSPTLQVLSPQSVQLIPQTSQSPQLLDNQVPPNSPTVFLSSPGGSVICSNSFSTGSPTFPVAIHSPNGSTTSSNPLDAISTSINNSPNGDTILATIGGRHFLSKGDPNLDNDRGPAFQLDDVGVEPSDGELLQDHVESIEHQQFSITSQMLSKDDNRHSFVEDDHEVDQLFTKYDPDDAGSLPLGEDKLNNEHKEQPAVQLIESPNQRINLQLRFSRRQLERFREESSSARSVASDDLTDRSPSSASRQSGTTDRTADDNLLDDDDEEEDDDDDDEPDGDEDDDDGDEDDDEYEGLDGEDLVAEQLQHLTEQEQLQLKHLQEQQIQLERQIEQQQQLLQLQQQHQEQLQYLGDPDEDEHNFSERPESYDHQQIDQSSDINNYFQEEIQAEHEVFDVEDDDDDDDDDDEDDDDDDDDDEIETNEGVVCDSGQVTVKSESQVSEHEIVELEDDDTSEQAGKPQQIIMEFSDPQQETEKLDHSEFVPSINDSNFETVDANHEVVNLGDDAESTEITPALLQGGTGGEAQGNSEPAITSSSEQHRSCDDLTPTMMWNVSNDTNMGASGNSASDALMTNDSFQSNHADSGDLFLTHEGEQNVEHDYKDPTTDNCNDFANGSNPTDRTLEENSSIGINQDFQETTKNESDLKNTSHNCIQEYEDSTQDIGELGSIQNIDDCLSNIESLDNIDDCPSNLNSLDHIEDYPSNIDSFDNIDECPSNIDSLDQIDDLPSTIDSPDQLEDFPVDDATEVSNAINASGATHASREAEVHIALADGNSSPTDGCVEPGNSFQRQPVEGTFESNDSMKSDPDTAQVLENSSASNPCAGADLVQQQMTIKQEDGDLDLQQLNQHLSKNNNQVSNMMQQQQNSYPMKQSQQMLQQQQQMMQHPQQQQMMQHPQQQQMYQQHPQHQQQMFQQQQQMMQQQQHMFNRQQGYLHCGGNQPMMQQQSGMLYNMPGNTAMQGNMPGNANMGMMMDNSAGVPNMNMSNNVAMNPMLPNMMRPNNMMPNHMMSGNHARFPAMFNNMVSPHVHMGHMNVMNQHNMPPNMAMMNHSNIASNSLPNKINSMNNFNGSLRFMSNQPQATIQQQQHIGHHNSIANVSTTPSPTPSNVSSVTAADDTTSLQGPTNASTAGGGGGGGMEDSAVDDGCPCNMRAMVVCLKCGAFCHHDCITPARICGTCLVR